MKQNKIEYRLFPTIEDHNLIIKDEYYSKFPEDIPDVAMTSIKDIEKFMSNLNMQDEEE